MSKRVGILGGTFDPIHVGHLIIAEQVADELNLEKVYFVPSARPPHKQGQRVTDAEQRYRMTLQAVADNPRFAASRVEIEREGLSYTVETLKQFKQLLGKETELYFIIGADALQEIGSWYKAEQVFQLCRIAAVKRPGYSLAEFLSAEKFPFPQYLTRVHLVEVSEIELASTEIRRRVAQGKSIKYLVPAGVEEYILSHNLYRAETN